MLSVISVWIVYGLIILVYATAFTLALVDLVRENKKALNIQQSSLQQAIEKSSFNYNKRKHKTNDTLKGVISAQYKYHYCRKNKTNKCLYEHTF